MRTFKEYKEQKKLEESNKLLKGFKDLANFKRQKSKLSPNEQRNILGKIYDEIFPELQKRMNTFKSVLKKVSKKYKNSKIKIRIKTLKSVVSKIITRGVDPTKLSDLVAGMIITKDKKDSEKATKDIQRKLAKYVKEVDVKRKGGSNKSGYYGVTHIDLNIDGLTTELQVLPKDLEKKKAIAHDVYTKVRDSGATEFDNQLTRKLFFQGNKLSEDKEVDLREEFIKYFMED